IEQVGTGIEDMISRLKAHGLPEPEFIQNQILPKTTRMLPRMLLNLLKS
ncbi:MAG: hypothetical protein GX670_11290, partial [Bacteroidales bacterium]|nr:hypothetical protein [Bacteroidales bacterium]